MKKLSYILIAFSVFLLVVSLFSFLMINKPIEERVFYASVEINDSTGVDVNSSALTFGRIPRNSVMTRGMIFENPYDFPVVAIVQVDGDIDGLITGEGEIEVGAGETKKIGFNAESGSKEFGFYDGNVSFLIYKG